MLLLLCRELCPCCCIFMKGQLQIIICHPSNYWFIVADSEVSCFYKLFFCKLNSPALKVTVSTNKTKALQHHMPHLQKIRFKFQKFFLILFIWALTERKYNIKKDKLHFFYNEFLNLTMSGPNLGGNKPAVQTSGADPSRCNSTKLPWLFTEWSDLDALWDLDSPIKLERSLFYDWKHHLQLFGRGSAVNIF